MKILYTDKNFGSTALSIIGTADKVITDYADQGLDLTLRQLYYQFVAGDLFPDAWLVDLGGGQMTKNHERNYKKLGKLVTDARLAGMLSWRAIEDRTRQVTSWHSDDSPEAALDKAAEYYSLDPWRDQEERVEIWVEKEALAGVFESVAMQYHVSLFCCRGYHSASSAWEAAQRIGHSGHPTTVLHFGDHDPSGLDMTRDIGERFRVFGVDNITIKRCALNMPQVKEFNPPPSPAKITDSRAKEYIKEFGTDSWELDAMSPSKLQELAKREVWGLIGPDAWEAIKGEEENDRERIVALKKHL